MENHELQELSDSSLQGTLSVSGAPGPLDGSSDLCLAPSAAHALYVTLNSAHLYVCSNITKSKRECIWILEVGTQCLVQTVLFAYFTFGRRCCCVVIQEPDVIQCLC